MIVTVDRPRLPAICDACDCLMFLIDQPSGETAYRALCGCRLRPVSATALECAVSAAAVRRFGEPARFALHVYFQRLEQVRVGPVPEEVTCVWQ
ncbi:hypothetical protein [Actinoplanes sp. NBRC 103695]|uniref:hypothetical protein n=1 Tax=Actinoplanes sp. NBRC 103695 TaxID=3032202 RepID=UPI0025570C51|nr:hypothetical protein [Actinoplanes sp. NBRC 103695]